MFRKGQILLFISLLGISGEAQGSVSSERLLPIVEISDYWVAYESPTPYAVSMTFAGDTLWLADFLTGVFYKSVETANGLMIVDSIRVDRDPFVQARDLTWDGHNLWSVNWGDLLRHDMNDSLLTPNLWITEAPIGSPNLHHMKGLAWDGSHLWSALDGTLYRHNNIDFSVELTIALNHISPGGMSFKDGELWLCNRSMGFIERVDPYTGSSIQKYSIVPYPHSLAWSKTNLWVYDWSTNRIYKILSLPQVSLDPEDDYLQDEYFTMPPNPGDPPDTLVWTLDASPYLIEDGFNIPPGTTLIIEPGVKVYVKKGAFEVNGRLIAMGTADSMIVFSHANWDEIWGGLVFNGEEASASILKYVKVQYSDNGIKGINGAPQRVEYCIFRKLEVYGVNLSLISDVPDSLYIAGNRLEMGGGVGIKMILSSQNPPGSIVIRENRIAEFYSTGPIIESEDGSTINRVPVIIEHNIFEKGYRGAGSGTPGISGLIYRHNLASHAISGSGIQPFHTGNRITHNLIEYTFENAYQLHPGHFVTKTIFQYNTVKWARFDHNWGDATIVVEYNNLIPSPDWKWWMEGVADIDGGYDVEMRNNWWGTNNLEEIRSHILDQNIEEDRGYVWIEPILISSNGIGFIRGRLGNEESTGPVPEVQVMVDTVVVYSNVAGEFFLATREGPKELQVIYPDGQVYTYNTAVTSGEVTHLELHPGNLVSVENGPIEKTFQLYQNYPNPFNASTRITYSLQKAGLVKLEIFNILGQRVRVLVNEWKAAGEYSLIWDGKNDRGQSVSSSVYFVRFRVADFLTINKMLLMR